MAESSAVASSGADTALTADLSAATSSPPSIALLLSGATSPASYPVSPVKEKAAIAVDRWGFIIDESSTASKNVLAASAQAMSEKETKEERRERIRLEVENLNEWRAFMVKWDKKPSTRPSSLAKLCRRGVPEELRAKVWMRLAGADVLKEKSPSLYSDLIKGEENSADYEYIIRDINRTFPSHSMFRERESIGQKSLLVVLNAYAVHNKAVGYCQGMGFITAMLLSYMPAEDTFFMLAALVELAPYNLAGLYQPDMMRSRVAIRALDMLLPKYFPKFSAFTKKEGIDPSMYLTPWVVCLFTTGFPFHTCVRFWDMFLLQGWPMAFKMVLAILKAEKHHLKTCNFETALTYLRGTPVRVGLDTDKIINEAVAFNISDDSVAKVLALAEKEIRDLMR